MAKNASAVSPAATAAEHGDTRHTANQGAAAEHATSHVSDACINAFFDVLSLGLQHYTVSLTHEQRDFTIATVLYALATEPGDGISMSQGAGDLVAKWWDCVVYEPPKRTDNSKSPVTWKEGKDVDNFISWVRLCQRHREDVAKKRSAASAAEQGVPGSLPSWRGGLELSADENTQCFRLTMNHILENECTPAQRRNPAYQWTLGSKKGPSTKARSLHDTIVRKHLGHKNTTHHIYQHGLPRLFALRLHSATAAEHRGQRTVMKATDIMTAAKEAANWMRSLTSTLFGRNEDVHTPFRHLLSARLQDLSPELREERLSRISSIRNIADQVAKAKKLANDRNSGKRKWEDLSRDDMQLLEDFDTQRLHKWRKEMLVPRGSAFRSQLSSASAAAEHAAASARVPIKELMKEEEIIAPRGSALRSEPSSASAAAEHAAASASVTIKVEIKEEEIPAPRGSSVTSNERYQ